MRRHLTGGRHRPKSRVVSLGGQGEGILGNVRRQLTGVRHRPRSSG